MAGEGRNGRTPVLPGNPDRRARPGLCVPGCFPIVAWPRDPRYPFLRTDRILPVTRTRSTPAHARQPIARDGGNAARRLVGAAMAGVALLALSGCGSDRDSFRPGCPNVGIVRDAATWRQEGGVAVMARVDAACEYEDTGVTVTADLTITGRTAEGANPGRLPLEYFVVVTDPQRNVIAKQVFATGVDISGGTGAVAESLVQFIPAAPTVDARWYEVLVGFQLPPEQVETNRRVNEGR